MLTRCDNCVYAYARERQTRDGTETIRECTRNAPVFTPADHRWPCSSDQPMTPPSGQCGEGEAKQVPDRECKYCNLPIRIIDDGRWMVSRVGGSTICEKSNRGFGHEPKED